jgi:hypothetical protein
MEIKADKGGLPTDPKALKQTTLSDRQVSRRNQSNQAEPRDGAACSFRLLVASDLSSSFV